MKYGNIYKKPLQERYEILLVNCKDMQDHKVKR